MLKLNAHIYYLTLVTCLNFCFLTGSANADQNTESIAVARKYIAHYFNKEPNHPIVNRVLNGQMGWGDRGLDLPVIKYIKGESTTELPTIDSLIKSIDTEENRRNFIEQARQDFEKAKEFAEKIPPFDYCKKSSVNKRDVDTSQKLPPEYKNQKVLFDMLVIPEGDLTPDPKEVYGEMTMVVPYNLKNRMEGGEKASKQKALETMARSIKIRCIPSRVRIVHDAVYHYEGLDALKNYDQKDEGELHPAINHLKEEWR